MERKRRKKPVAKLKENILERRKLKTKRKKGWQDVWRAERKILDAK